MTENTQVSFPGSHTLSCVVPTRTVGALHKTNSSALVSLPIHGHSTDTAFHLLIREEGPEGGGAVVALPVPVLLCYGFQRKWLPNTGKLYKRKGCGRVLDHSDNTADFFLHFKQCALSHRFNMLALRSLCILLNFIHRGCTLCAYASTHKRLHCSIRLSLRNTSSERK